MSKFLDIPPLVFLWGLNADMTVQVMNQTFYDHCHYTFGIKLKAGMPIETLFPPSIAREWHGFYKRGIDGEQFLIKGGPGPERLCLNADIQFTPIEFANQQKGVLMLAGDISQLEQAERARLETQAWRLQKLEAIGTLAGGIAHDFNNILGAIMGYAELAMIEQQNNDIVTEDIEQVLKAAERGRELVKQILAFSRTGDQEFKPLRIHLVIREAVKLLRATIPATVDIQQDLDPDCGTVIADHTQIHQIVMNLCTNAYHAISEDGVIKVQLKSVDRERDGASLPEEMTDGRFVRLSVSDNGKGIDKVTLNRIFDPFFTTKSAGKGTGMGLAVVHGIVKSHKGFISVDSAVGEGTAFHIYFPAIDKHVMEEKMREKALPGGSEHILFVDDEAALVQIGEQTLGKIGYKVTGKTNGLEALTEFEKNPGNFDLVITDQTMPTMTGAELAKSILKIRPEIPIILVTGFSETISKEKAKKLGIREFLLKPVSRKDFAAIIRKVLDES